ncbi:ubiquinone/menaquinone biosynthesis methyltransferase [Planotetraspora thailandica]|uniref:Ubiquinone/menaquinone biosynthesis methyltransferase n=1 Tax=Planotetraspora thailandica TaxID=487172 RepID=A0A8J3Y1S5_9ACTN|nr:methyltransferase domain-containing protein [Planotetraspora thailandica]GII59214.1 ubiquinone/menaquinone biosynthesis methyltransferase [Planotetraspora thailandica]
MTSRQYAGEAGSAGDVYERLIVLAVFTPWTPELVALAAVRPGERVLDLACGTGIVTRAVARTDGTDLIVGLDVNPSMLAAARDAAADLPIEWREGDAAALPFPDGAFDVVLCQQGLQFFPDRPAALAEAHRVLAPGGRALFSVWRSTRDTPGWRALEEALARRVGAEAAVLPPFSLGDARRLRALLSDAGFRDIRIRSEAHMSRFPSAEAFVHAAVAGAPSMLGPLADQGEAVLEAIVAEVAADLATALDDDGLAFPQPSNVATAGKP